jgi:DNA-binding CsgD family transcriptional regulator/tetratricopeptide (TPR) repeat protein
MDLLERDDALASLHEAVEQARLGHGRCVLVHGEAGIGKSSLLKLAFRSPSSSAPIRVLWGGCEALFSPRPLGPLYDMARDLGPQVRALLGRDGERSALFASLLDELRASPHPTVLVFEDIHWADAATLDLLKYLARRIDGTASLLVLSFRDDEIGERHPLRSLLGDLPHAGLHRIALSALSESGVEQLVQRFHAQRHGLYAVTRGNPFFVIESLRGEGVSATVRDAVLSRASRQSSGVRALLDLAAVVPSQVEIELIEAILGPTLEDVTAALASGLLLAEGRHFRFRHELARRAIEGALSPPVAVRLHARVLAQLESGSNAGEALARIVHHAAAAGQAAAVLRHAPQAAEWAAMHGAHREAAGLYEAALVHAQDIDTNLRADLLERHAYQCYLISRADAAVAARQDALAIWRQAGNREREGHNLRWLSRLHWFLGQNTAAERFADQAIAVLSTLPPGLELAWALSNRSQLHMLSAQTDAAVTTGLRAIELAAELDDVELRVHALNNVGTAQHFDGLTEGLTRLESSLQLSLAHGLSEHVARAYVNLVSNSISLRQYDLARRYATDAAQYFASRDLNAWVDYLASLECGLDFEQGRWTAATDAAMKLVESRSAMPVSRLPALVVLARLRMRRGDPGVAEALAEATALARDAGELQRLGPVALAHVEAAWLQRDDADLLFARSVHQQAIDLGNTRFSGELTFWLDLLAEPGSEPADPVRSLPATQQVGQWDLAAASWDAVGCPFERALAQVCGSADDVAREALADLDKLGAKATAERCRDLLRFKGVKGIKGAARGPRASTLSHPAGLTQREAQLLLLMAQGLTNAEIAARISRSAKTVDHHISAILGKLQARSRAEASVMAVQLGLLGSNSRE